jgi:D-3-phosphoglycerate dehydrogenase / 2-oxoglutarate reductase
MATILFIDSAHPHLEQQLTQQGFTCVQDYASTKEQILQEINTYSGIVIRSRFKLEANFLKHCAHLKFIARVGAGMENIDVTYATSLGIKCLHAPEGNRVAVAEQCIGMLLSLFNNINKADAEVRNGVWLREGNRGVELAGKTIGIIGMGNMGSALAQCLQGFGCTILVHDKYKTNIGTNYFTEVNLQELKENADIISIHLPYNAETHYFINKEFINQCAKNIYIINTARGKCLNTHDVVQAMQNNKVLGVCLDVLEYETTSFESIDNTQLPEPWQYLIKSNKAILTPHIAGWTHESNYKMAQVLLDKIMPLF